MSGNWTPGPWELSEDDGWIMQSARNEHGLRYCVADLSNYEDENEFAANAHLIAAAPCLYEAAISVAASLAAAISLLENGGKKAAASDRMFKQMLVDYRASLKRARAALKKARGEI